MKRKLSQLFSRSCLTFMMIATSFSLLSQNITIRGTVKDVNNESVIGATIIVNNDASRGTVSDYDGNFILTDIPSSSTLQVSYVGMIPQTISVDGRSVINIVMA
ncbi:MAG: carboxypeptidase-like regulatory domain-containing protein, partial [Fermentimonas sp.]|nr:carboxypeptidase-like regulatory domain-containing protein [Fermentimonas sp.]